MECKLKNRNELITNYLMGELPENEAKIFEEHYFQCEICFKELRAAEDAMSLIGQEGPAVLAAGKSYVDKDLKSIIHRLKFPGLSKPKRWRYAIAAAASIVLILFIIFINRNDQEVFTDKVIPKDNETEKESYEPQVQNKEDVPGDDDILAELTGPTFEPEPYLEEWIKENTRAFNERVDTVISPQIGEKFYGENIIFEWRMNDKEPLSLKIFNNREEEIFILTSDENQLQNLTVKVSSKIFTQSGLFYWRIEDENEVLFVGKFYFLK